MQLWRCTVGIEVLIASEEAPTDARCVAEARREIEQSGRHAGIQRRVVIDPTPEELAKAKE